MLVSGVSLFQGLSSVSHVISITEFRSASHRCLCQEITLSYLLLMAQKRQEQALLLLHKRHVTNEPSNKAGKSACRPRGHPTTTGSAFSRVAQKRKHLMLSFCALNCLSPLCPTRLFCFCMRNSFCSSKPSAGLFWACVKRPLVVS